MSGNGTRNYLKAALAASVTIALFVVCSLRLGPLPAMGSFLDPVGGFWQNTRQPDYPLRERPLKKLVGEVSVVIDEYGIPHIYAENDHDLYFIQGYLTARDRLWQMDMTARSAAGRLAEVLGPSLAGYDTAIRKRGMAMAAEKRLAKCMEDPRTAKALEAYAAGINAWIESLDPATYPFEYKLMGFSPEPWSPLKTSNIAMSMAQNLSYYSKDKRFTATRGSLGADFIRQFIKDPSKWLRTVIPEVHEWEFNPLPVPESPKDAFSPFIAEKAAERWQNSHPHNGSNNWAIHGSRTSTGYPLLANDPHLEMTLPATWHLVHLKGPEHSVMGVSIPGTPGVIIGFNENIAWGVTNAGTDVLDYYQLKMDPNRENQYFHDGEWKTLSFREEVIQIKGEPPQTLQVPYTHHGPVEVAADPEDGYIHALAMRWTAHDSMNDILTWYLLNRALDYDDFVEAIGNFDNPSQNFVFASREGDIALHLAGKLPLKWQGQGDSISDGSNPQYDWNDWIPRQQNPAVLNPARGFVSSANQFPANHSYPYYLGHSFATFERGRRINDFLEAIDSATLEEMQALQLDTFSYHAAIALPFMLDRMAGRPDQFTSDAAAALLELKSWNFMNEKDSIAASVFRNWWITFFAKAWKNRAGPIRSDLLKPDQDRFLQALTEDRLDPFWFDDPESESMELLDDLVQQSFSETIMSMQRDLGPMGTGWALANTKRSRIDHLARIRGFGSGSLDVGGGYESVNAIGQSHGPSFRMVVELGPDIRARGIYPGGQSGAPGSARYDDFLDHSVSGGYLTLVPYSSPDKITARESLSYTFKAVRHKD